MTERPKKIRLGDLLVEQQAITEAQLMAALQEQKDTGNKLGRVLIDSGLLLKITCWVFWQVSSISITSI